MNPVKNSILWIEPFAYKPGEPFRVMPIGSFKRGERTLDITPQRLNDMAANYAAQRPRWKIPIYAGHPTDTQPDPPKLGNVAKLEVKVDGLYAVPEYSDDGAKMAQDGYQYCSPGVLWSLNGSRYVDDQGQEFDNVIDHVALTNRPFFGSHTALFSADPEVMQMADGATGDNEDTPPDQADMAGKIKTMLKQMLTMLSSGSEVEKAAAEPFAVWTTAFMNDLPDSSFLHIESGGEKDADGKTTPRSLRHFPYKDASGKVDLPHLRNALARIPQSNLPADVKARVISKAQRLAASAGIGTSEKTSDTTQEREDMADTPTPTAPPPEGLVIKPDEFAAIKAKAEKADALEEQMTALKAQTDQFAAALKETKRARRSDQLVARYEAFTAVPEKAGTLAEKMLAVEEKDPELFKYFDGLLATLDKALMQAELFGQIGSGRSDETADTLEAVIEQVVKEKFDGDMSKYAEAMDVAQKQRPDLAQAYRMRPRGMRG